MIDRRDRIGFAVVLTALSGLFVENGTSSSPWLFVDPWGLMFVLPLYGLHVLVLARISLAAPRPSLPLLYVAGALLGLYEALITKVLWSPTWGPTDGAVLGGLHVLQTAVLVLFAHPVLAFMAPLVVAETHLVARSGILAGMPPRLAAALRSPRGLIRCAAGFAVVLAAHHAAVPGGPLVVAASAALNTLVVAVLLWWWRRRYAARPQPSLAAILPGRAATARLAVALGLLYVGSGVLVRPEGLPRTPGPYLVLAGLYAVLVTVLARLVRRTGPSGGAPDEVTEAREVSAREVSGRHTDARREPEVPVTEHGTRTPLLVFLVGYPLVSAALAAVPAVAAAIVVVSWLIAIPYGGWQLLRAARLSLGARRLPPVAPRP